MQVSGSDSGPKGRPARSQPSQQRQQEGLKGHGIMADEDMQVGVMQVSPPSKYKSRVSREGTYAVDCYTTTTTCAYQPQVESRRMYVMDCLITMAIKPLLLQQAAPPRVYLRLCLNTMLLTGLACLGLCLTPSAVLSSY